MTADLKGDGIEGHALQALHVALEGRGLPAQVLQAVPEVHRCTGMPHPQFASLGMTQQIQAQPRNVKTTHVQQ